MEENSDLNLSQILFKPQPNYIETSLISNSGAAVPDIALRPYSGSGFHANWYRPLNRYMWSWMGGNPLDIEEALSNIACSEEKRSRENRKNRIDEEAFGQEADDSKTASCPIPIFQKFLWW